MQARDRAESWLSQPIDQEFKASIQQLIDGPETELIESFYKDLEFGTGGMRGVMGVGSNRVNKYTFGMATQGFANYLKKSFSNETIRIAVAHDCRHHSKEFAQLVADIMSANGIEVLLFNELRPTPQLSFAVREHNCHGGVVITASHNPPEYNGYKVYWNDGAQVVAPHDAGIIEEVRSIDNLGDIKFESNPALISRLGEEEDQRFIQKSLEQRKTKASSSDLKVVLTSLHGTSITTMPSLFAEAGYDNVHIVEEQAEPNGDFPTVKSPNPEEREALDMALNLADQVRADVVIGTDPDSDRIGVAVRGNDGNMMLLNGNQTGVLLTDYLIRHTELKPSDFIAYTIVSSDMFGAVAKAHNVDSMICLTGFKHIAKLIRDYDGERRFLGGGEESYGYMVGDFVRDKDALTSALLFADLASEAVSELGSVEERLMQLYRKHGLYVEKLTSITKKGIKGAEEIEQMMKDLRNNPPASLGGEKIVSTADISTGIRTDLITGETETIDLPKSNVLQFFTEAGSKICARPSGTEPKIKFYFSMRAEWVEGMSLEAQQKILTDTIDRVGKDLNLV